MAAIDADAHVIETTATFAHLSEADKEHLPGIVSQTFGNVARNKGMSRLLLKFVQQALLVEQATQPWPAVQGRS